MRASGKPRMAVRKMLWGEKTRDAELDELRADRGNVCVVQGESEQAPWIQIPQTEYSPEVPQVNPQPLSQEPEVQD